MLRREISPRVAALLTIALLAAVTFFYWRGLVYEPPGEGGSGSAGGRPGAAADVATGLQSVQVETLAGEEPGFRDGPLWQARFCGPNALALAPDGSLFVADSRNHRIRRIAAGRVSTVAGGEQGELRYPSGVAVAPDGTLFVADTGNHRIGRLEGGRFVTLAGGAEGRADGTGAAARFRFPAALFLADGGSGAWALWVADVGNGVIRRVAPDGTVTTPAPRGPSGSAGIPASVRSALGELAAPPDPLPIWAAPEGLGEPEPTGFAVGQVTPAAAPDDSLRVVADAGFNVLLAFRPGEAPVLIAGRRVSRQVLTGTADGEGHRASFAAPCAVVMTPDGTAYVAEYEANRIRRVRLPSWLAGGGPAPRERGRLRQGRGAGGAVAGTRDNRRWGRGEGDREERRGR